MKSTTIIPSVLLYPPETQASAPATIAPVGRVSLTVVEMLFYCIHFLQREKGKL